MIRAASQRLTPRSLTRPGPVFRLTEIQVALALVIGLRLITRDWTLIAERPVVLTDSSWLTDWVPITPTSAVLVAVQVAGLTGVAAVVTRRYPASGFAVAVISYTLLAAWWGSSGKIMHNELLTVTVAAVPRAQEIGTWIADHGWTAQLLAGGALLLELGAPALLAFRATRIPFVAGITIMHTSIWFMLGLDYSAWILTAAAVAIPMAMPADKRVLDVVRSRPRIRSTASAAYVRRSS